MIVKKINYQNDFVVIKAINDDYKVDYKISLDDFDSRRIQVDKELSDDDIEYLENSHKYFFCLTKCLKKLANKDLTAKEVSQYLNQFDDLSSDISQRVITTLSSAGYLDTNRVIESQFYSDQLKLKGKLKTASTLKKRGLDPSLIQDALLKVDSNEEFQRALAKAIQIEKSQRNMSYKQKVYDIKQKLVSEGFTNCDEVVEKLNLSYDDNQQIEAGQYHLTKILRQYRKKYKDKKLKEMCYKYLFSKGFNSEVITNLLERNLQDDN